MQTQIFWIENLGSGRLGVMTRPRGGDWLEDEIGSIRKAGVNVMVSLLEKDETTELDLLEEESLCKNVGIEFISFPIPDRCVPSSRHDTYNLVRPSLNGPHKL